MRRTGGWQGLRLGLGGLLVLAVPAAGVADDEPPSSLSGPSLIAPGGAAGLSAGVVDRPPALEPRPPAASGNRPMLVIPGVNAPSRIRARSAPLPRLEPAGTVLDGDPGVPGLGGRPAGPGAPVATAPGQPSASPPIPLTNPGPAVPAAAETRPAPTAPGRATNRLGRYLAAPFAAGRREPESGRSAITVEPSNDPAAEAALKRRIERQVHEAVGDKAQEVEVRVVGRAVTIRARGVRFWQRRSVRRTLESLPGLAGLRPTVEIDD